MVVVDVDVGEMVEVVVDLAAGLVVVALGTVIVLSAVAEDSTVFVV
jgi:hypothetical protein